MPQSIQAYFDNSTLSVKDQKYPVPEGKQPLYVLHIEYDLDTEDMLVFESLDALVEQEFGFMAEQLGYELSGDMDADWTGMLELMEDSYHKFDIGKTYIGAEECLWVA